MKVYGYKSHQEYVDRQVAANRRKLHKSWVKEPEIEAIAEYIRHELPHATFGICHGARSGWEVRELRKRLGIEVIGTDISETAATIEHMVQFDFHEGNDKWTGRTDFIYSNALDHSYDPQLCLNRWLDTLAPGGLCLVHWSTGHNTTEPTHTDCAAVAMNECIELMLAKHHFHAVVPLPVCVKNHQRYLIVGRSRQS